MSLRIEDTKKKKVDESVLIMEFVAALEGEDASIFCRLKKSVLTNVYIFGLRNQSVVTGSFILEFGPAGVTITCVAGERRSMALEEWPLHMTLPPLAQPEFDAHVPEQILEFLYSGKLALTSVEAALQLMELSQHRHPSSASPITRVCLSHLLSLVDLHTAVDVLAACHHLDAFADENLYNELVDKCYELIDLNAEQLLKERGLGDAPALVVATILSRDSLAISSETIVHDAAVQWAIHACYCHRLKPTPENLRKELGPSLYLIRYLTMSREEFAAHPLKAGLLLPEELEALLGCISGDTCQNILPGCFLGTRQGQRRRCVPPQTLPSSTSSPTAIEIVKRKRRRSPRKFLHSLGDFVICVIQLLD